MKDVVSIAGRDVERHTSRLSPISVPSEDKRQI
jgi:hypothetical protein